MLTLRLHLPPSYVLDEMEMYEAKNLLNYQHYAVQDEWEQTRFQSYITAQVNSTKRMKVTDLIEFPWEKEQSEDVKPLTKEEREEMKRRAETIKELYFSKNE